MHKDYFFNRDYFLGLLLLTVIPSFQVVLASQAQLLGGATDALSNIRKFAKVKPTAPTCPHLECARKNELSNQAIYQVLSSALAARLGNPAAVKKSKKQARDCIIAGSVFTGFGVINLIYMLQKGIEGARKPRGLSAYVYGPIPVHPGATPRVRDAINNANARRLTYKKLLWYNGTASAMQFAIGLPTLITGLVRYLKKPFIIQQACGCHEVGGATASCQASITRTSDKDNVSFNGYSGVIAQLVQQDGKDTVALRYLSL